ncbi:outer membrane protein [Sphingomonas sp. BE123]|jgi:outer membrane protein|uniref:OmpH family outer membrane protein n=1 Tax=unclassified Sphingomonas TaxID=196159 RepID=UPI002857A9CA|nr:OmpH family outer membrane protein [Sphingomonas sp. BE123]MDR6850905.1 outer membrane protein [Sphingomonas sp. BE123]
MRNTKTFLAALAVAGAAAGAGAATAQTLADAKVAVVDVERVMATCAACVSARTQLQTQQTQFQQFAQQQSAPLQTERTAIEAALRAANGKQDAALDARVQAYQKKAEPVQRVIAEREQVLRRNAQYVDQQITARLLPVIEQVANQRGATIAVPKNSLLFSATAADITDPVLAALNQQLPTVNTVAPPPPAQPAQQPAQPAPTGR